MATPINLDYLAMNLCNMASKPHFGEEPFGIDKVKWTMVAKKACVRKAVSHY